MNLPINETGKRIQNYVFNYSDFLGAGNFSKCYKGYNEITSKYPYVFRRYRCHKNRRTELIKIKEIRVTAFPINLNTKKA